jgi:hypothetical protein
MKVGYWGNRIIGAVFTLSLLFAIGLVANQTAQAQYPDRYRRDNDQYRRNRDYDQYRRDRDDRNRNRDYDRYNNRGRSYDGYPNMGGSFQLRQTALNAGYNAGLKAGREDARHNRRYGFRDSDEYQRATKDYSSRLGDRELYRRYFRLAFPNGYDDGLRGY